MIAIIIVLSMVIIYLCFKLSFFKKEIQNITSSLEVISGGTTNQVLNSITMSKDMVDLVNGINELLIIQNDHKQKIERVNHRFIKTISNLSHDLKTPLTSALGYAQMLSDPSVPQEKKQAYAIIITKRLRDLSELIQELLYYSQILETDKPSEKTAIHLKQEIEEIIGSYYDQLVENNFRVNIFLDDNPCILYGDMKSFYRIIGNILQNTIHHGYEEININLINKKLSIANKVKSSEDLDPKKMFDRFYYGSSSPHTKSTGLGLTIVKELVLAMGKNIDGTLKDGCLEITIDFN